MIKKLKLSSLVAQGGLREAAKGVRPFFDAEIISEENVCSYEHRAAFGTHCPNNYTILVNAENKVIVFYMYQEYVYVVDEVFDDCMVIENRENISDRSSLSRSIALAKDDMWYCLDYNHIRCIGKKLSEHCFYDEETKTLRLVGYLSNEIESAENIRTFINDYQEEIRYTVKGKKVLKIYSDGIWHTPVLYRLFPNR